ncbi:MAG TPA: ATP-binding cassette domain-containing protein [Bryobacteraceae bacterium]|nr:ATP-binding cassette domain-containing protein [Bryobacteraceae bacterium]
MAALVEFRNVRYEAGGREILRGVHLTVEENETVVLLGRSGSGKTTLLKMVNGLVTPSAGEVRFAGTAVQAQDVIHLRRRIGYVIQDGGLFPHRTVAENTGLVPALEGWPREKTEARVAELLNAVGLAPAAYGSRYPRQLSGGEKQRVGIARALAADPPLLLLDEPFAALDPVTRFGMQRHFVELRKALGKTAIFVTHDIREALALGTRIALLKDGAIETIAPAEEFARSTSSEARAFLATIEDGHAHA